MTTKQSPSEWARAALKLPDLIFLVLDTTHLGEDADICRIVIADRTGYVLYDQVVQPQRKDEPNTDYTGISYEQILQAPTLADCWDDIQTFLEGSFVVGYNIQFIQGRLRENAEHYHLPKIPLVTADLQKLAQMHFQVERLSLKSACERIDYALPSPAFAQDRIAAQLALLHAMSKQEAPKIETDLVEEIADHPF